MLLFFGARQSERPSPRPMQLVIFDIDGTLTDTNEVDAECYSQAFADAFGFVAAAETWARYPDRTDSGIAYHAFNEHLGRPPTQEELERFKRRFFALIEEAQKLAPRRFVEIAGAAVALSVLRQRAGTAIAIATGGWDWSARFKLASAGISVEGVPAAFADDAMVRSAIVRAAIARAKAVHATREFERITCVGDSSADVETARAMGLPFVGVGRGGRQRRLTELGASCVIADYTDIAALVALIGTASIPAAGNNL
jgi:phosphoglycolate phosphatase-like HAD superfamily hydrolase